MKERFIAATFHIQRIGQFFEVQQKDLLVRLKEYIIFLNIGIYTYFCTKISSQSQKNYILFNTSRVLKKIIPIRSVDSVRSIYVLDKNLSTYTYSTVFLGHWN